MLTICWKGNLLKSLEEEAVVAWTASFMTMSLQAMFSLTSFPISYDWGYLLSPEKPASVKTPKLYRNHSLKTASSATYDGGNETLS